MCTALGWFTAFLCALNLFVYGLTYEYQGVHFSVAIFPGNTLYIASGIMLISIILSLWLRVRS
jgi:di/tricarboxylate transporter